MNAEQARCRAEIREALNRDPEEIRKYPDLHRMGVTDWIIEDMLIEHENGNYNSFLEAKRQCGSQSGFTPLWMPDFLFDFQRLLTDWAIRGGRRAIFADCGLGKTPMQLVWAENVVRKTNKAVLILTPLAVGAQTVREAEKFGIECHNARYGTVSKRINVVNYERLHYFHPSDFAGVVCDESSILKSFDGKRRSEITEFMRQVQYRLLCTATAAPNDYIELGTSSESLGELGHLDMLARFFKNDQHTIKPLRRRDDIHGDKWVFKAHAEIPFWRWVCSWARAIRRPSDLGFIDGKFILPPLEEKQHVVSARSLAQGMLFAIPAIGLKQQREERNRTIMERAEKVASLVNTNQPALVWCHLNEEGDTLAKIIPDAQQVSGRDSDEAKEDKFLAFLRGHLRVLITKPKIGAWGLNFQHCNHTTFFPTHSFEQYYQGVRRCWRFGQTKPVRVDIVTTEAEQTILGNLQRKARAMDMMFTRLVEQMAQSMRIEQTGSFTVQEELPRWL